MVDGLLNKKVAFIIQARMQSTRLPGKSLIQIPMANGKPLLKWITDALLESKHKNEIVLATSTNTENDVLASFCIDNKITCFRGDEKDVLSRFLSICENKDYDCVVRLTADNPILDIDILDQTIDHHFLTKTQYTKTEGLPIGMNFEIVNTQALLDLKHQKIQDEDREHVTLFIKNTEKYSKNTLDYTSLGLSKLRLTLDYSSDYTLLSNILSIALYKETKVNLQLIKSIHDNDPWLFDSNAINYQKIQYPDKQSELNAAIAFLKQNDFINASQLLKSVTVI